MRDDKEEARKLRKEEKSYREISEELGVPKSTLSDWLRDKEWSQEIKENLDKEADDNRKNHLIKYSKKRAKEAAQKREKDKQEAAEEINKISEEGLKLIGISLYWAEGGKTSKNEFNFSNSDPKMIRVMMKFLRKIAKVPEEEIQAKIHLYPDTDQQAAIKHWQKVTDLPEENFPPPQVQVSRASKGKRNTNTLPYGTLHIRIYDTELISKMKGWIQGLIKQT